MAIRIRINNKQMMMSGRTRIRKRGKTKIKRRIAPEGRNNLPIINNNQDQTCAPILIRLTVKEASKP